MSLYIDDAQRHRIQQLRASWRWRSEWPTWLLIVAVYGGWFATALNARSIGIPLAVSILAVLSCLYLSLQHELLHGHPTRFPLFNALLGVAPLAVWFPYAVYRESHLRHHDDVHLTDPDLDPESYFVSAERWRGAGVVVRFLLVVRNTLLGRILLGPWFSIVETILSAFTQIARGNGRIAGAWALHLVLLGLLAAWLERRCGISPALFIVGVGYPALALSAIRSFQEHRAADHVAERSVINEASSVPQQQFSRRSSRPAERAVVCGGKRLSWASRCVSGAQWRFYRARLSRMACAAWRPTDCARVASASCTRRRSDGTG
jgi:fatty acid desaturase